jgi:hypothetical protein
MSTYDNKSAMWIDGPDAVDKWVATLQNYGIEFHAWCVPRGLDIVAETDKIIQVCQRPGVRSMILDVEPYNGFWAGGREAIRPFMLRVRAAIPGSFHIGMSVDSRKQHYARIWPEEWYPFVDSVHPQVYWIDFQNEPPQALANTWDTWGNYNKPIIPALSGYGCPPGQIDTARTLCITKYKTPGVSYWVFGQIGPNEYIPINYSMQNKVITPAPGADGTATQNGTPIVVTTSSPTYSDGIYDLGRATFGTYNAANGIGKYRPTDQSVANVYAMWDPQIKTAGWYLVEAYVPNRGNLTGNARYKIHGIKDRPDDYLVSVAQSGATNNWATLGTFFIDPTRKDPGLVFLNDWTFEVGREVVFDAIRWTPINALIAQTKIIDMAYRSQEDRDAGRFRNDCGPACIAMLIEYVRARRGQPPSGVSIDTLSAQTSLKDVDNGLFTRELIPLAAKYNVTLNLSNALDLNAIIEEVRNDRPVLMLVHYGSLLGRQSQNVTAGHFLLVVGYDSNNIYVNDPDWWNQAPYKRENGKNWKIPITQFRNAINLSPAPKQGLKLSL